MTHQRSSRVLYFDCAAGASGDMLLSSLLDLGDARDTLRALLRALRLPAHMVRLRRVAVASLSGLQCRMSTSSAPHAHTLQPFIERVQHSRLPLAARRLAVLILQRLARAERRVHRGTAHAHRVHEIGGLDTVIAIAGCVFVLHRLRVSRVLTGPVSLGCGWTRSDEGLLPNPGPAVLELLRGFPVTMTRLPHELVTPTAAAILSVLARPVPSQRTLTISRVGYGVGTRRMAGTPGIVRACLSGTP